LGVIRTETLEAQCRDALRRHLSRPSQRSLRVAGDLGRRARACGLGPPEMSGLLQRVQAQIVECATPPNGQSRASDLLRGAEPFVIACLTTLQERQAQGRESCRALRLLNERREQDIRRIARRLHDTAFQLLTSVRLSLEDAGRSLGPVAAARLHVVRSRIDEVECELRRLSHELRPPALDDLGLLPAVRMAANGIARRPGLEIRVRGGTAGRMTSEIETALYRIVQEALVNTARHARADAAEVDLDRDGRRVTCRVTDRGVGFDPRRIVPRRVWD
jgi:signal transduction histidine kinase